MLTPSLVYSSLNFGYMSSVGLNFFASKTVRGLIFGIHAQSSARAIAPFFPPKRRFPAVLATLMNLLNVADQYIMNLGQALIKVKLLLSTHSWDTHVVSTIVLIGESN